MHSKFRETFRYSAKVVLFVDENVIFADLIE